MSVADSARIEAENLSLVFRADVFRAWTLRDAFVRAARDPVGALLKERDRFHALRELSFRIGAGERVALIGVNGSGKTTLCRAIAGILRPTSGTLATSGRVRAYFDTSVGILPELTGRENARLLAEFLFPELDARARAELVAEAVAFADLGEFADVPFRLYSNGMQARLFLSLVSAHPSEILVLDEVFEGADAFFRERISARVLRVIEASGTVLFVSHHEEQIRRVCTRALVLDGGSLAFDGGVDDALAFYHARGARA